jgi:cellulose synthase operon protein C
MPGVSRNPYILSRTCCSFLPVLLLFLLCMLLPQWGCQRFYEQQKNLYLEKGRELFQQGAYIPAAKKFQNALVYDDRCTEAMYMLGQCNLQIEDYKTAVGWFEKVEKQQPDNLDIKLKIAEIYLAWGRPKKTEKSYEAILAIDPKNTIARKVKLEYFVQNGRLSEAENLVNELLKEGKQDTRFYKVLTEYYIKRDQYPEAVKTALEHFTFSSYWMKAITQLIQGLKASGSDEELIKIYTMIIDQALNKVPYQEALSTLYRKANNKEREEQLFQKLLKSNPNVLQIKLNYIDYLLYYKQQNQAKVFLDLQLKENPEATALTESLVNYYVQTQQINAAVQLIQESLAKLPRKTNSYVVLQNKLAAIYFDNGDFDTAAAIAEDVMSQSPSNRDARFLLCKINLVQGDIGPVIGELRLLSRENQNIAEFHYYLGLAHDLKDEPVLAEREFREALTINPNYKDALKEWVAVYPMQGALTEVELRIDKYLRSNPEDQDIIALREEFLKRKGDRSSFSSTMPQAKPADLPGLR